MAKRKQRAARIASVALLSSTVFANPPPAKKPADVIVNRPNPAHEQEPVDAGTRDDINPVMVNEAPARPVARPVSAPDAGVKKLKK